MTLSFEVAIYLVIFGLVDRAFIAPAPVRADRLDHESPLEATSEDRRDRKRDTAPYPEAGPYLSLRVDDVKISEYREDEIDEFYLENRQVKRDSDGNGMTSQTPVGYSHSVPERTYGDEVGSSSARNHEDDGKPFLSVPFETVVTITRDNVPNAAQTSFEETRNPTEEFSPCLEKEYSRREIPGKPESQTKPKDSSLKRRITGIANFLRVLRKTVRKRENMKLKAKDTESTNTKPEKPDEEYKEFAETPIILFEDDSPQQKKNETSQRQELDDEEEESQGSLGSLTDFLPIVLPILQDLSNPDSPTDLAALLEATVPIVADLFGGNNDPNAPNILNMVVSAVTTVLGGAGGQGLDFAEIAGPLLEVAGPFITPIIGPIVTYAIRILTNPDALIGIIKSLLGAVTQTGPDGTSPILNAVTDFAASVIKDLRPGAPGGLDVAAIVEAVTTGAITAISEISLGTYGAPQPYGPYGAYAPYGPYGTGPVQAASVNSLQTIPGVVLPPPDTDSIERTDLLNPIAAPANTVQHRTIKFRTTRRPQVKVPKRTTPRPPYSLPNFLQHYGTDPVQALPANNGNGGSSYAPYGHNGAVPASSVNPFGLIISSIQDVAGDGIKLVASLINAVFGIMGASSADSGPPTQYGPPAGYGPPPPYGHYRPQGAYKKPS